MSSDETPSARDAVREKAQQVQARQSRSRRIRLAAFATAGVAVVAVAAVVVSWAVGSSADKPMMSPANVDGDGFFVSVVGAPDGPAAVGADGAAAAQTATPVPTPTVDPTATAAPAVDIRVYVDYLSSGSRDFQVANSTQLSKWVNEDAATLTYYPVALLTAKSNGTKYSLRAAGSAACVATYAPEAFFNFNDALLQKQPDVDSPGLTDQDLASLAIASGAGNPKTLRSCIEDEKFSSWARAATERALKGIPDTDGVALTGTPMVLVNGIPYAGALDDPKEFAQFVLTIASDAYYKSTATPTPTPTPTPTTAP